MSGIVYLFIGFLIISYGILLLFYPPIGQKASKLLERFLNTIGISVGNIINFSFFILLAFIFFDIPFLLVVSGFIFIIAFVIYRYWDAKWRKKSPLEKFMWYAGNKNQDIDEMEKLLQNGEVYVNDFFEESTPLIRAVDNKNIITVEFLLSQGANPNEQDGAGDTPLHIVLYLEMLSFPKDSSTFVNILFNAGADPNIKNNDGNTPLHLIMNYDMSYTTNTSELIDILLQHGADPTIKDNEGKTPKDYAKGTVYEELFKK